MCTLVAAKKAIATYGVNPVTAEVGIIANEVGDAIRRAESIGKKDFTKNIPRYSNNYSKIK